PDVQLPAEPHHRPPREPDAAPARPRARRRPRSDRRRARHPGAGRGTRGGVVRVVVDATEAVTVGAALAGAIVRLRAVGVPEPEADAQVLAAHALGTSRAAVVARSRDAL